MPCKEKNSSPLSSFMDADESESLNLLKIQLYPYLYPYLIELIQFILISKTCTFVRCYLYRLEKKDKNR